MSTNRLSDRELAAVFDAWFDDLPATVSDVVVANALARVSSTRQQGVGVVGRWTGRWPVPDTRVLRAVVILTALMLLVSAIGMIVMLTQPPSPDARRVPPLSPSPRSQLTVEATPSEPASAAQTASAELTGSVTSSIHGLTLDPSWSTLAPGLVAFGFGGELGSAMQVEALPGEQFDPVEVTGPSLLLEFTTTSAFNVPESVWISRAGECQVNFSTATEKVLEATFTCVGVPSPANPGRVDATGQFSLLRNLPLSHFRVIGAGTFSNNMRAHFEPVWDEAFPGLVEQRVAAREATYSDQGAAIHISWRPELEYGPTLATGTDLVLRLMITPHSRSAAAGSGEWISAQGECQVTFQVATARHLGATFTCTDVPSVDGGDPRDFEGDFAIERRLPS